MGGQQGTDDGDSWAEKRAAYADVLGQAWRTDRAGLIAAAGLLLVGSGAGVASALLVRLLVRDAGPHSNVAAALALLTAVAFVGVGFVQSVAGSAGRSLVTSLASKVDAAFQQEYMRAAAAPAKADAFTLPGTREIVKDGAWAVGQHWTRPASILVHSWPLWSTRLSIAGSSMILVAFHWWVAVLAVVTSAWLARCSAGNVHVVARHHFGQTTVLHRAGYLRSCATQPPGAKELRVFGLLPFMRERHGAANATAAEAINRDLRPKDREGRLAAAACGVVVLLVLLQLAEEASSGSVSFSSAAMFATALMACYSAVTSSVSFEAIFVAYAVAGHTKGRKGMQALADQSSTRSPGLVVPPRRLGHGIVFEGVHFSYPGAHTEVLRGLDLTIPAGSSMALVGVNGVGKTTLVKLIAGLLEPTSGRILVDGTDLRDLELTAWRRHLAVIFQDFVRFQMPLRDNVGLGAVEHLDDVDGMTTALARAGLPDLLGSLGQGWDTVLSAQYKGGRDLSGGQWQRVALARALFAASHGADVLILDEPTANLDVRGEADLYRQFMDLTAELTTIVVSHRFSTVRQARHIAVIREGRLAELGSHAELMELGGQYAHMFRLQADRLASPSLGGEAP